MSVAEQMAADALEAQKFTRKHFVVGLDFSPTSLNELDPLCDDVEFLLDGGKSDQNILLLTRIWGAYVGELLRIKAGGDWVEDDCLEGEPASPRLQIDETQLTPHEQVYRRLTEGVEHHLERYANQFID